MSIIFVIRSVPKTIRDLAKSLIRTNRDLKFPKIGTFRDPNFQKVPKNFDISRIHFIRIIDGKVNLRGHEMKCCHSNVFSGWNISGNSSLQGSDRISF